MKIDTSQSHVNLCAERAYSQKQEITIKQEIKFSNLFDQRLERLTSQAGGGRSPMTYNSDWLSATSVNGMDAVQLSQRFVSELENCVKSWERFWTESIQQD